jgi:hypothetical protein
MLGKDEGRAMLEVVAAVMERRKKGRKGRNER